MYLVYLDYIKVNYEDKSLLEREKSIQRDKLHLGEIKQSKIRKGLDK